MNSETKNCQNCRNDFVIEPDDFLFYEKIKVPPPTFCPHCRFVRRMIWRNERSLYKRKCDMCDKSIISMYDDKTSFPVYCVNCYKSDNWGPEIYAKDYDFSKSFFMQWKELFGKVPRLSLWQNNVIESDYSNYSDSSKNVYLGFSILTNCEDVYYSGNINNSKQIIDSYNSSNSELIFEDIGSDKNYNSQYSYWSSNCINCNFVFNCNNCQNCFGCVNLNNKKYFILNEQYTKEQYEAKIKDFDMGNYSFVKNFKKDFWVFSLKFPRKYANIVNSIDSTGDELKNCKNTKYCFNVSDSENVKYGYRSPKIKDSMDVCHSWASNVYEHALAGSENSQDLKFIINGNGFSKDLEYLLTALRSTG